MNHTAWGIIRSRFGRSRWSRISGAVGLGLLGLAVATSNAQPVSPEAVGDPFRIAFTRSMFTTVNVVDAEAAIRVWIEAVVNTGGQSIRVHCRVVDGALELRATLVNREVDAVVASVAEFMEIEGDVPLAPIFSGTSATVDREEYLLLVRRDGPCQQIDDLRDGHTILWVSHRTSLAEHWLRALRAEHGMNEVTHPFGTITTSSKLSAVVLPVFFGQAEACVVTRPGWETLTELNPQVGLQLRPLASSEPLVGVVGGLRADYQSPVRDAIIDGLRNMNQNPNGRQVLMLFHGDGLRETPPSLLDSARALRQAAKGLPPLSSTASEARKSATSQHREPNGTNGLAASTEGRP